MTRRSVVEDALDTELGANMADATTKKNDTPTDRVISKPKKGGKSKRFRVIHGVVKVTAIILGLPLTVLSLMSLIGLVTDNFWIRLIPSLVVALGAPLLLVDRLLPDGDQATARGLPTDVLALVWLGIGALYIGLAGPLTGSLLISEGDRYAEKGSLLTARVIYWLGGATPLPSTEEPPADGDGGPTEQDAGVADEDGSTTSDGGPIQSTSGDASTAEDREVGASEDASHTDAGREGNKTYTPSELFKKLSPAVVTISARGPTEYDKSSGTGFFIDTDGTIATNHHVIDGATAVGVKLIGDEYPGGHRWLHEVELLVENPEIDLALLRVPPQRGIDPIELGDSDRATPGDQVICIGNPLGLEHTLSDGIVSARRVHRGKRWIQMNAAISRGNSGGPVTTLDGLAIGVATATVGPAQNLNLAVPINELKALIRDDYPDRRQYESGPNGPTTW